VPARPISGRVRAPKHDGSNRPQPIIASTFHLTREWKSRSSSDTSASISSINTLKHPNCPDSRDTQHGVDDKTGHAVPALIPTAHISLSSPAKLPPTELPNREQNSTLHHHCATKDPSPRSSRNPRQRQRTCPGAGAASQPWYDSSNPDILEDRQEILMYTGSYHWIGERVVSVLLVPLTLAPFAAGSLNPTMDAIFVSGMLIHSHFGFQYVLSLPSSAISANLVPDQ